MLNRMMISRNDVTSFSAVQYRGGNLTPNYILNSYRYFLYERVTDFQPLFGSFCQSHHRYCLTSSYFSVTINDDDK